MLFVFILSINIICCISTTFDCYTKKCCRNRFDDSNSNHGIKCESLGVNECISNFEFCEWTCNPEVTKEKEETMKRSGYIKNPVGRISKGNHKQSHSDININTMSVTDIIKYTTISDMDECGVIYDYQLTEQFAILYLDQMRDRTKNTHTKDIIRRLTDFETLAAEGKSCSLGSECSSGKCDSGVCVNEYCTIEWETRCISDMSRDCDKECDYIRGEAEICSCYSVGETMENCDNGCDWQWCRSNAKCRCKCRLTIEADVDCSVEDLNNIVWDANSCAVTELERVDEEIAEQISWNIAKVLLGNIPAVGFAFQLAFDIYDPVSHITSPWALVNQLRDDMNVAITELQTCMDEKISNLKIESVIDKQQSMITQYYETKLASGDTQIEAISDLFSSWNDNLYTIFGSLENNLLEYLGMLPAYQALYPLYGVLAVERAVCLHNESDYANIEYINTTVNTRFRVFERWIFDARAYIYDEVTQQLSAKNCDNADEMDDTISEWFEIFDERYIDTLKVYYRMFNTFINYITPTTTTTIAPKTLGEKCTPGQCVDGLFCSPKYEYTKTTRNSYRMYSTKICCDSSNYLNEYESCSCVAECQGLHNQNAMSCCNGKCRHYERFEDEKIQWLCPS